MVDLTGLHKHFILEHLKEGDVAVDFTMGNGNDTLFLSKAVGENEGGMYMNAAINILKAMKEKFMNFDPETDDMLGGGTTMYPTEGKNPGIHISIIYGDYFYTEAILKLLGSDFLPW